MNQSTELVNAKKELEHLRTLQMDPKYFLSQDQFERMNWLENLIQEHSKPTEVRYNPSNDEQRENLLGQVQVETNAQSEAIQIVKDLAAWSIKYPKDRIYGASRQPQMDGELISLEERAKKINSLI